MAILTSKDRKKLNAAAKKKKNTDTGRTAAEKQRKKSVAENTAAGKKKNKSSASKKKTTSSSVLNDTEKKEVEEIRRRTQSLRDRNTAVSQRDAYDAARRQAYGERQSVKESKSKLPSLFDESKSKRGSLSLEEQKKNVQGIQRNAEEAKDRNYWLFNNGANKPVEKKSNVPLQTQMTTEEIARRKSVEANQPVGFRNEWQAIAAAYAADVPRDLIGIYDKAVNIPTADYYLNDKYRRYMNGGVKAPVYMGIDPQKTAEAEAQAKKEGYNSLEEWQIAKANEAMSKTDGYYNQKRELYDTADKYIESGRFDPWVKPAMEVAGQIGALTPTIATAGAGGGIAKLIGLGGKTAWAFQNLLMGAEISGSVSGMEAKEMYNAVLNQKQNTIAFMGEDAYKAKTGNEGLTIDDYRDALKRANNTGELVGMAEAATEMLFGGIPLMGKGIVNKIGGKIGFELLSEPTKQQIQLFRNTIGGRIAKQVTERLGGTLGEGTEEAIMAVAQPYIETNVAGVESDVSVEDIIHDFGMGAAVSMILGLPVNAVNDTVIAYDAVQQRRQNKEFIKAAEERANELVKEGQMTEEEAAASVREVRDILSGKGSLRVAEEAAYEEKTESDTRRIYDSAEEAQKSLENEFKGKEIGDEIKGAYFDGEEVREFTAAKTEEGVKYRTADQTEGDIETYRAKAEKIKNAKNETERSGYQLNVKEDIIREVSALSKALGRTIVFDDVAKTYNEDGSANVTRGWFDEKDGSIHVNIHNETPAATVVAHEITHSMEGTNAYKAMQKAVFDYYRSSLGAERKERGALYIEGGKTLESEKDVDYEVMANFVETKLLTDKETINYIVKRNKNFGEKIVNGINRMIQRKIGSKEQKFLAGIRTKWEAALEESRKEGDKKEPSEDGKVAYAFGGEKAKTADLKKLGMAKNMLISGKSAGEIFRETGWFVGADGKWRFEIDDSDMVYHNQSKKGNPDQERQKELYNKMFAGDITQEEWKELSLLEKNGVRRQHQLEDYIDHTALFEAYPELRKVDLVFSSEDTDTAGKYNRGKNRIVLNDRYKKAAEEVLLHEIQHAIQQIEGFSGGTSREAWAVKDLGGDITKRYAEEYADLLKSLSKEDSNKYLRYRDLEFAMDRLLESGKEEDMVRAAKYEEESDAIYDEMYAEPWFLRLDKLYYLTNDGKTLYSYLYTNSAGEIEARDVSSRRKLSAEERRQKLPDIGNEDTVFAEDELADSAEKGNRKYSVGKERDREYMAAVERGDMEAAQRMVDQAAKAAGYDTQKLYHGTPDRRKRDNTGEIVPDEDWNVFDPNKSNADRIDGSALFFTDNKAIAEFYAPRKDNKNSKVFEVYLKKGKMLTVEGNGADWNRIPIPSELPKRKYRGMKVMEYSDTADTSYICKEAKKAGYDSVHFKNIVDGIANNKDMLGDVYAVFDSSQVKSADAVTYDDKGNVIPLSERFDARDADIRYAFGIEKRSEVLPSTDKWKRGDSFSEIKSVFPTLFELDADEAEKRNPTQIRGTVTTYRKIYDILSSEGFNGKILDASSGLGYGTRAGREEYGYDVDDVEPFPDKNYKPKYTKYADIEENYDVIISNAVLNVIPQDIRDDVVRQMGGLLKPGGRIFINVRGKEVLTNKSNVIIDKDNMEVFVSSTGSYQKGFTNGELKAYLEDALGNNYTVQIDKRFGGIAAVVEKKTKKYSYAKEKRGSGEYTYAIGMPVDLEGEKGYISGFRTLESGAVVYTVETFNGIYENVSQEQIKPRGYQYEAKKESEYRKKKYEEDAKDAEFVPRQTPEQREEARNYFVGDIVEINGERGTVTGRQLLKKGDIVYTVELDNGGTVDVSPDELTVGVTTDFFLEELTEEEQRSWDEAPDEWYMGIDLSEELENAITLKEFSDELYNIGMTISPRKLAQWFKQRKYFKPHRRDNRPSADSLANGYFIVDGKQIYITEKGRNHFSEMFAGKEVKLSKREKQEGVDLPGNERNKEGNPLEESLVKEMLNDYEDEIGTTNEDYWWARLLTGRGVTYSKDYARNFDAAASFNPNVRKHLQRIFVRPLEKAKADYTKAVRNQLNDFHAKMKELGIRKKSDEAAAVQWIGEGQYQDKYGEIHEYTEEMLKKEFPDTWEKIKEAADYCREIYDQYLTDINKAREKIYPHPVEDAEERKAGYEAKKKLCEERIKEQQAVIQGIEQAIEAKKNELPKKKDGSQAKADVLNSIRYNEDRLVRAKDKLKEYIDRKNNYESLVKKIDADIESGDVLVNKRIVARKDYFHHFQELTMNLGDVFSLSRNTTEIDPKMEGTSEYTQPKSKFSGITVHRKKGRYTADAVEGMIRYVQTGEYMIHIDPTIAEFRNHIKGIAEATKDSRNCNKLIRWLVQWTNDLAGKTNTVDRAIQDRINRNFMKAVKWLNSRAKANAVVGNLNSAAVQFFNIPNAAGYVHNPKYWIGGIKDFVKFVGRKQDVRSLLKQSAFVEERFLDDVINKFDERVIDKPGKLARWTLIVGDRYGTAYIWFTAYRQALGRNEKNPIEYADDITRRCVAGRGIGEIPLTQKSAMTQVFVPFQVEVNNAWQLYKERLGGVVHERTKKGKAASAMGFGTILITNFIFNSVTDLLLHRRVLYDPIYAFFSTLQSWMDDDDEDKDIGDLFSQLMGRQAGEVLSNMPFGSLIAYYAVNNDNLRKKFFGESDPTRFGVGNIALDTIMDLVQSAVNGENIADDLLALATTFGTPYGGKELERIIEGLVNMGYLPEIKIGRKDGFSAKRLTPGVYNKNGQLQYPVETFSTDWRQALTGMFFGKYATDAGQKYLGKDYEGNSWLRNILGMNQTESKKPLSERATEVYKNLVAAGGDAFEIYDTIREIQGAENSIDKRNILLNSELTGKEKLSILTGVITAKNNVESETEKINAVLGLGLNIDDYLTIRNMHATINKDESYEKAADRAWAFNNELIAAGYTTDQIKGINDTLKFWSQIPADTSKFDKLSTSGLDSETSMKVIEALSALEPLEDETQVSSLQKVEAIAGLNLSAEDEKAAMSLALDKKQYAKYRAVTDYGVTAQVWADFEKALANADANNANEKKRNGSYDKEEKAAALDSMNISNDTKAALWQIKDSKLGSSDKDTAWKAARNPYSSSVGAAVVDAYLSNDQSLTETGAVEEGFGAPLPTGVGRKSSEFGYRTHPISGKWKMHSGVDIAAPAGTPVLSVSSGTVKEAKYNGGYGNQVVIQLEDGSQFSYSHLKSYGVKKGDVITKGQQIGEVGSTGSSTGNHLHLEAINANGTKVDPETVVDIFGEGIKTSSEYTAVGGGGGSSGGSSGGSRSGGSTGKSTGRSSGGSASGGRRTTGTSTASTGSRRSSAGSGTSGGSSGGVTLPTASQASAITGRSTKATTYSQGGVTLPTAKDLARSRGTISSTASAKSTQRTGRSKGSFWNENILG